MKKSFITDVALLVICAILGVNSRGYLISDVRLLHDTLAIEGYVDVQLKRSNVWKQMCVTPNTERTTLADIICTHLGFPGTSIMALPAVDTSDVNNRKEYGGFDMSCPDNGQLVNCTGGPYLPSCEEPAYITCDTEPTSCNNRCGRPSNLHSCGCDEICVTFGDCCSDFSEICPVQSNTSMYRPSTEDEEIHYETYESCVTAFKEQHNTSVNISEPSRYMMVSKCPPEWKNLKVAQYCESEGQNLVSILPVHNQVGVLFKNSYCALCHGTRVENMLPWKLESIDSQRMVVPPRYVLGYRYEECNEGLGPFQFCPPGVDRFLSENCPQYRKPDCCCLDGFVESKHCAFCNSCGIHDITNPVTFDVIFGLKSWSDLSATCGGESHTDVSGLFQNACPLLEELTQLERHTPRNSVVDSNGKQCLREFMSNVFQLPDQLYQVTLTNQSESTSFSVILPNKLTFLHLENALKKGLVVPRCKLMVSVHLSKRARCDDGIDVANQPFEYKNMTLNCDSEKCDIHTVTSYSKMCENITCRWENEYLSPIDFKIENFISSEMIHVHTGATLTHDQFKVTTDGKIHTCSEYLIGPWIKSAFYVQIICGPLSLICIVAMIMIHVFFSKLRNIYGFCIVSLLVMIFMSLCLFMLSTLSQMVDGLAQVVVILSQYTWLSSFAWMTVISFHVSHTFGSRFVANRMSRISNNKEPWLYGIFGWGIPIPFLVTGITLHICRCTSFQYTRHWMSRGLPTIMLFAVPAGVLALTTAILFILGIAKLRKRQATPHEAEKFPHMHNYLVALRLCFIVGLPWALFIIYAINRNRYLLPILTLVNSLQGCFIFISFVTTRRVRSLIAEKVSEQLLTSTTYSKGKNTAQTDTGSRESTPQMKRGKSSGRSSPSNQPTDEGK